MTNGIGMSERLPSTTERSWRSRVFPHLHDESLVVQLDARADVSDIAEMPRGSARRTALHERLLTHAARSQQPLLDQVAQLQDRGFVDRVRSLHSPNALIVEPTRGNGSAVLRALQVDAVESIWGASDGRLMWRDATIVDAERGAQLARIANRGNTDGRARSAGGAGGDWNLRMIGARSANEDGARGRGTKFGIIDTGVDPRHPQLRAGYAGRMPDGSLVHDHAWHDFGFAPLPFAHDRNGHGTRVASIAVGRDIGVAPDATWIAARASRRGDVTARLEAMQWMLAPTRLDGSDPRPELAPDVLGISWNAADPRETFFADSMRNLDAAGIYVTKAAGNEGLDPNGTITSPGQFEDVTTVAAVDRHGVVAPFSSHGPSPLPHPPGAPAIAKPDVAAPGVDVVVAVPHMPFLRLVRGSGTSYAQPHVAGAALLMLEARRDLTNGELGWILKETARDAGSVGHDVRYGAGIIDIPAALETAGRLIRR